jgi:hypothetical protein
MGQRHANGVPGDISDMRVELSENLRQVASGRTPYRRPRRLPQIVEIRSARLPDICSCSVVRLVPENVRGEVEIESRLVAIPHTLLVAAAAVVSP